MAIRLSLLILVLSNALLFGVPLPQEHPPREGQPAYCVTNHADSAFVCKCMDADKGKGCVVKDGSPGRDTEDSMLGCKSFCRISHCHCCIS